MKSNSHKCVKASEGAKLIDITIAIRDRKLLSYRACQTAH